MAPYESLERTRLSWIALRGKVRGGAGYLNVDVCLGSLAAPSRQRSTALDYVCNVLVSGHRIASSFELRGYVGSANTGHSGQRYLLMKRRP